MVRTSLVKRYCYLNVKDLHCKQTDTSIWRVTHSIWRVRNKKMLLLLQRVSHKVNTIISRQNDFFQINVC